MSVRRYATGYLGVQNDSIIFLKDATQAQMIATFGNEQNYRGQLFHLIEPSKSRVYV